jgi:hypothetical protein
MKPVWARQFSAPHPLWKKSKTEKGVSWDESPYYFWWRFLRLNRDYEETCRNGGRGPCSKLYEDFGDVFETDFKEWFQKGDRGSRLFAEPKLTVNVEPLTREDLEHLLPDFEDEMVVLAINKSLAIRDVMRRVRRALKVAGVLRKRGQRTRVMSKARYPLATTFKNDTLKKALKAYLLKLENPRIQLWRVGHELGLNPRLSEQELDAAVRRGSPSRAERDKLNVKKNTLAVGGRRYLRNASSIIKWVGKGKFPVLTTTEKHRVIANRFHTKLAKAPLIQ